MDYEELAADVVARARKAGAEQADVLLETSTEFDVTIRKGDIETLTQAGRKGLGLRVFVGGRQGFASTSDFEPEALKKLVQTTVALAAYADSRSENGLPTATDLGARPEMKLYDPGIEALPAEQKIALAKTCEAAAFAADPRITNTEGTGFGSSTSLTVLANSHGSVGTYHSSACSLYCAPLAEADGKKQVDYDYSFSRNLDRLDTADEVGRRAAMRVLRKLDARKVPTQKAPIVFDRRCAVMIWYAVLNALDGDAVFKEMSFLKDSLGKQIAARNVTLIDDGTLMGGAGSAPFDGEGVPTRRNELIRDGVLQMFLYDSTTARKANTSTTANARRSYNGLPRIGPFNLYLAPGNQTTEEIIRAIPNGFFVTDLMGQGGNPVTGDFSAGAAGLWIENGELTHAVEEVTIAGTMHDILQNIERIGTDVLFTSSVVSPTFQVAEMTISGS